MASIIIEVPDDLPEVGRRISAAIVSDAIARLTETGLRRDQIAALLAAASRELDIARKSSDCSTAASEPERTGLTGRAAIDHWRHLRIAEELPEWTTLVRLKKRLQGYSSRENTTDSDLRTALDAAVEMLSLVPACYKRLVEASTGTETPLVTISRDEWRTTASESDLDNELAFCFLEDTDLSPLILRARVAWILNEACVREDSAAVAKLWSACDGLPVEFGDAVQAACSDAASAIKVLSRERAAFRAMKPGERVRQSKVRLRLASGGVGYQVMPAWLNRLVEEGVIRQIGGEEGEFERS